MADAMECDKGLVSRPVLKMLYEDGQSRNDNSQCLALKELMRFRVFHRWAHRHGGGHINCAPQWYNNTQATAWVNGFDACYEMVIEMLNDWEKLCESVPDEDLNFTD